MTLHIGWQSTKYPNEYIYDTKDGLVVVRLPTVGKPYARCYKGGGGEPVDLYKDTLEECFQVGTEWLTETTLAPT